MVLHGISLPARISPIFVLRSLPAPFDKIVELKRNVGALSHVTDLGIHRLATNRRKAFRKSAYR